MRQSGRAGTAVVGERHVAGGASALAGIEGQPVAYSRGPRRISSPFSPERLEEVRRREAEELAKAASIEGTEPEAVQVTAPDPAPAPASEPTPAPTPASGAAPQEVKPKRRSGGTRARVETARLTAAARSGMPVTAIAEKFGLTVATVRARLKQAGIVLEDGRASYGRRVIEGNAARDTEIVRLLNAGVTFQRIAQLCSCSIATVSRVRKREGLPLRSTTGGRPAPAPPTGAVDPVADERGSVSLVEAMLAGEAAASARLDADDVEYSLGEPARPDPLDDPVPFTLVEDAARVSVQLEQMHAALADFGAVPEPSTLTGLEAYGWSVAHERALCTAERMEALAARMRELVARMGVEQIKRVRPRIVELERAAVEVLLEPFGEDA